MACALYDLRTAKIPTPPTLRTMHLPTGPTPEAKKRRAEHSEHRVVFRVWCVWRTMDGSSRESAGRWAAKTANMARYPSAWATSPPAERQGQIWPHKGWDMSLPLRRGHPSSIGPIYTQGSFDVRSPTASEPRGFYRWEAQSIIGSRPTTTTPNRSRRDRGGNESCYHPCNDHPIV